MADSKSVAEKQEVLPKEEAGSEEVQAVEATTKAKPKAKKGKKARRTVARGQIHVLASFNNTVITITDTKGNVLTSASAGSSGFRGSKKGTAYASQIAAERAISSAKQSYGVKTVDIFVRGVGLGRDAAIRTVVGQNVDIESIRDVTPVPHGGVRSRRPKRN